VQPIPNTCFPVNHIVLFPKEYKRGYTLDKFFALCAHVQVILKSLTNIESSTLPESDGVGFRIDFTFSTNEFFTNTKLSKVYHMADSGDDPVLEKAEGTEIEWHPGKNVTVTIKKKKQRNKNGKGTRVVTKTEPCESFFNFFSPPCIPGPEEEGQSCPQRNVNTRTTVPNWSVCVCVCTRACIHVCTQAFMHMCVCVPRETLVHVCISCVNVKCDCIFTFLSVCTHQDIFTCKQTYGHWKSCRSVCFARVTGLYTITPHNEPIFVNGKSQ
jgi:hypothetical protein